MSFRSSPSSAARPTGRGDFRAARRRSVGGRPVAHGPHRTVDPAARRAVRPASRSEIQGGGSKDGVGARRRSEPRPFAGQQIQDK